MVASDRLLRLITRLQHNTSLAHGRRMLLQHVRASSGAQLAVLFTLDQALQVLVPLAHSGRLPAAKTLAAAGVTPIKRGDIKHIPLDGLFASSMSIPRPLYVPDLYTDLRTLAEEKCWGWPHGGAILYGIRVEGQPEQGVLVLCFMPDDEQQGKKERIENEGEIEICGILLSMYLSTQEQPAPALAQEKWRSYNTIATTRGDPERIVKALIPQAQIATLLLQLRDAALKEALKQERERIACDIHDGALQSLVYVLHKLEFIQRTLAKEFQPPTPLLIELARASNMLEASLQDLRHTISSLVPTQLAEQGFVSALRTLVREYMTNNPGLQITCDLNQLDVLPASLEAPIFRFVQEALNNISKHAEATHVIIHMHVVLNILTVEVHDNGVGFQPERLLITTGSRDELAENTLQIGLRAMQERVRKAGGDWEVQSRPGTGTTLLVRFPLAPVVPRTGYFP